MKQVIVVRRDLDMGAGKLAVQVAHAAISAYEAADADDKRSWRQSGQEKIVLGVDDEEALQSVTGHVASVGLPHATIRDAGRTELEPGTFTALGIGPDESAAINAVTGDLSLY